ncbi:MAG: hypothetical protein CL678_03360 [Bdellovibrionaceae bacterium]|nr:hypothetical protein [Pseudobdellovibrionaceae bacterium]
MFLFYKFLLEHDLTQRVNFESPDQERGRFMVRWVTFGWLFFSVSVVASPFIEHEIPTGVTFVKMLRKKLESEGVDPTVLRQLNRIQLEVNKASLLSHTWSEAKKNKEYKKFITRLRSHTFDKRIDLSLIRDWAIALELFSKKPEVTEVKKIFSHRDLRSSTLLLSTAFVSAIGVHWMTADANTVGAWVGAYLLSNVALFSLITGILSLNEYLRVLDYMDEHSIRPTHFTVFSEKEMRAVWEKWVPFLNQGSCSFFFRQAIKK